MKKKERFVYVGIILILLISLIYTHIIVNRELTLLTIKFKDDEISELKLINKFKQKIKELEENKIWYILLTF